MIITHPGRAHRDEFIAICIWMAIHGLQPVFRREPSAEELNDPKIAVFDVGGKHEPDKWNFDHHQESGMDCALVLMLKHLELFESAREVFPWVDATNAMDTTGPFAVAKSLGISADALFSLLSPIEEGILKMFEENECVDMHIGVLMADLGHRMFGQIRFFQKRMAELEENVVSINVKGLVGTFSTISDRPTECMDAFQKAFYPSAAFSVSPRGKGWAIYRIGDHPGINFFRVANHPSVEFAHPNGFIAKTKTRLNLHEVEKLVEGAII